MSASPLPPRVRLRQQQRQLQLQQQLHELRRQSSPLPWDRASFGSPRPGGADQGSSPLQQQQQPLPPAGSPRSGRSSGPQQQHPLEGPAAMKSETSLSAIPSAVSLFGSALPQQQQQSRRLDSGTLGFDAVARLIAEGALRVENAGPRVVSSSGGVRLRLGRSRIWRSSAAAAIGRASSANFNGQVIPIVSVTSARRLSWQAQAIPESAGTIAMTPGEVVVAESMEEFDAPPGVVGHVQTRGRVLRVGGVLVVSGSGNCVRRRGHVSLFIKNMRPDAVSEIPFGAWIAILVLHTVCG